jgi:hypothetical protein
MSGPIIVTVLALVVGVCFVPISKWIWRELFESEDMIAGITGSDETPLKQLEKRDARTDYLGEIRNLTGI